MQRYNNPKKNKNNMVKRSNKKITDRGKDEVNFNQLRKMENMHVDRIMLEREMTSHDFSNDNDQSHRDRHNNNDDENENENEYVGEVTGEQIDGSDVYAKGMPVRSAFSIRKSKHDNNSHLDFNLYDKIDKKSKNSVTYNDMMSDEGEGDYADLNTAMNSITRGNDPYEVCVTDVNITTNFMHTNMFMIMKNDFVVNGFGLFMGFGVLYLVSRGNTEMELKEYFGFQDKNHLNAGLLTIRENTHKYRDQIIMDNYLINDRNIPSLTKTAQKLKSLIFNIIINRDYPEQEALRVNNIIKTVSGVDGTISSNTLLNSEISLVSIAKLAPIWAYKVNNIIKARFDNELIDFIRFMGKTFDYYEDSEKQLIEVPMHGGIFVVGLILAKQNFDSPTSLKSITSALNFIKPTVLDEVLIPVIKKRYKTRLNKTLQKTGLNIVFNEQEIVGLFPEGGTINDCLQYVDIIFSTRCANKISNNKGYRTTRKFVANKSFEFYLRNTENNCIMMMGRI
jgi:hypothetical protein